jgi:hypothetical protein
VDAYFGWRELDQTLQGSEASPALTHPQVQTLLAGIGNLRQFDIWVPLSDRPGIDWSLTSKFALMSQLPPGFDEAKNVLQEIDVVWVRRGSGGLAAS